MRALPGRRPAWLTVAIGVAAIAVGVSLAFKPFSSLGALILLVAASLIVAGAGEVISGRAPTNLWLSRSLGLFLIATGVAVLISPDATIGLLPTVVGVALVIGGLTRVVGGVRGPDDRFVLIVSGLALVVLGGSALAWPDLTVLGVALLVGPAAIILGIGQVIRALSRREAGAEAAPGRLAGLWRYSRPVIAAAALVLVLGFAGISYLLHRETPTVTAFYRAPANLPVTAGQLLRQEDVRFQGMPASTNARRVLYTTTKVDGSIAVASAVVAWPKQASDAPRPVLAWTHGTTGVAQQCAPSLLTNSFDYSMPPAVEAIMKRGWVIVATDYIGLGTQGPHPYLIGVPEGRSELDAVRAARHLEGVDASNKTVVWGHSQGGHAALWVGIEAARYAPDVPLSGMAALAPASDLAGMATRLGDDPLGTIFKAFIITAYSKIYPDVSFDDYVRASARLIVRETAQRCIVSPEILAVIGLRLSNESVFARDFGGGPLAARLEENIPDQPTGVPTFIGQGLADVSVIPELQRAFAERLCAGGQIVDYRGYAGRDHMGVIAADSPVVPDVLRWTEARFAGESPGDRCLFAER